MGLWPTRGMIALAQIVRRSMRTMICFLAVALLAGGLPLHSDAKSYSSGGGPSYSSHSSSFGGSHSFSSGGGHNFGSGGSHSSGAGSSHNSSGRASHSSSSSSGSGHGTTFKSSGGKSYSSGSTWIDSGRHSYTSAKSYSSGAGHTFASTSRNDDLAAATRTSRKAEPDSSAAGFTFDQPAARARKEEASKAKLTQFKEAQLPPPIASSEVARSATPSAVPPSVSGSPSYRVKPPPVPGSAGGPYRPVVYVPDAGTISTRPARIYNVFNPYW